MKKQISFWVISKPPLFFAEIHYGEEKIMWGWKTNHILGKKQIIISLFQKIVMGIFEYETASQ